MDSTTPWHKNDELFLAECRKGHGWERYVAMFLTLRGLNAHVYEQSLRDTIEDAGQYLNSVDVLCEGCRIEVKSRDVVFHTPEDFPYETILIDTVSGWEGKNPRPHAVVCVSQQTGAMIVLNPKKTLQHWLSVHRFDNVRQFEDWFYEAPRGLWKPIEALTKILRKVQVCRPVLESGE